MGLNVLSPSYFDYWIPVTRYQSQHPQTEYSFSATGSGFQRGVRIYFNGRPVPTTYVSSTQLSFSLPFAWLCAIPKGDQSGASGGLYGFAQITIQNPGNDSRRVSYPLLVTATPQTIKWPKVIPSAASATGAPEITKLEGDRFVYESPPTPQPIPLSFDSALPGHGFQKGATVLFNGWPVPTQYVSESHLGFQVPSSWVGILAKDATYSLTANIYVRNPNGLISQPKPVTIIHIVHPQ